MTNARIPTSDWLKDKLDRLVEITDIVKKENPDLYSVADPDYGFWSIKKEIALMYWSYPFQIIASKYFKSFYYIDLFAGSGLMKAEDSFFVGSPIVAVNATLKDKGFSKYVCVEYDRARKEVLEKRMDKVCNHFKTCKPNILQADSNQEIDIILKECGNSINTCFLAFVDPQKYTDLNWKTLERLMKHGKGDIILNFPTMSITRNLGIEECIPSLSDFFGDELWTNLSTVNTDNVLEHFKRKIRQYRSEVDSLEVRDDLNHRLFDLIFATNSQGMKNVVDDLKKKLDSIHTKDIKGLYSVVAQGQKQMKDFFAQQEGNT
jgi:three-Cys-motif partner protein